MHTRFCLKNQTGRTHLQDPGKQEIREDMDWIHLAQDGGQYYLVKAVMTFSFVL